MRESHGRGWRGHRLSKSRGCFDSRRRPCLRATRLQALRLHSPLPWWHWAASLRAACLPQAVRGRGLRGCRGATSARCLAQHIVHQTQLGPFALELLSQLLRGTHKHEPPIAVLSILAALQQVSSF
jgi:hypothetical protein